MAIVDQLTIIILPLTMIFDGILVQTEKPGDVARFPFLRREFS